MTEKSLISKSATIGVVEIKNLMEMTQTMGHLLTPIEYAQIALIYNNCIERLLEENGEPI